VTALGSKVKELVMARRFQIGGQRPERRVIKIKWDFSVKRRGGTCLETIAGELYGQKF